MKLILLFAFVAVASANLENFKISDYLEITENGYQGSKLEARSENLETNAENFIKSHDVTFKLPIVGSTVALGARNLDQGEVDVKIRFNDGAVEEGRKKSKLKKIFAPIFIFILLKAMVLIPLALGILAIKTWNAIQLSFVSFVIAIAMAVWNLCKKVSGDNAHPQIIAHDPWESAQKYTARAFGGDDAQKMAYSAYAQ